MSAGHHGATSTAEAQRAGREASTAERNVRKGGTFKWGKWVFFALLALTLAPSLKTLVGHWTRSESSVQSESNGPRVPTTTQGSAEWDKAAEDGTIPVNEWSKSYMIPPGGRTSYDAGNCIVYKVRFRLYGGAWSIHDCKGGYPPADEIQFMMLKPGHKKIPFSITMQ